MPKISFSSENKVRSGNDYPKLQFQQTDETARIAVLETEPEVVYMHILRAPRIVNGEVVMKKITTKAGQTSEVAEMDFIGKHACFGNFDRLVEVSKDPANCPTCAAANEDENIGTAERRFALHVIRYKTQPGSYKVQTPLQVELLAWTFANKVYDTLVDIAEEHKDLRAKDLLLKCTNKTFQNVDIQIGGACEWQATPESQALVKQIFSENRSEDLAPLLARKVSREIAADDVAKVRLRYAQAYGGTVEPSSSSVSGAASPGMSANMDLDNLLGGGGPAAAPEEPKADSPSVVPDESPSADVTADEPNGREEEPKSKAPATDLASILEGL